MSEKPLVPPSVEATSRTAVGGDLLSALDSALEVAWDNDCFVEACAHDEGVVGAFADLEFAIEVLRSALVMFQRPDPTEEARGGRE